MTDKQKTEFIENVKKWVSLDNQSKEVFSQLKTLRQTKNELNERINDYVTNNNMQKTRIEISDGDVLTFGIKREYQSITFTYIEKCMKELFPEPAMVDKIMKHLRDKRTLTTKNEICRKGNKDTEETE